MTAPRQLLPGTTFHVTRRCALRQFLLKPSKVVNQVFLYVLALAARRHRIRIHAFCVMSNHYHLVLTDPDARLPAFEELLDALVARALNALYGRRRAAFWDPDPYTAVELVAPRDVVDKAAYALANPVAAGLVRSARKWPGLWSSPHEVGAGARLVPRPTHFFDPDGGLPDSVPFKLTAPPGFVSAEAFREQLEAALAEQEAEAAKKVGWFLGVARVKAQRVTDQPRREEPRRQIKPRVAARDPSKRVAVLQRLAAFLADYRAAWLEWSGGHRRVVFPEGTYQMRVAHGAACAGAG